MMGADLYIRGIHEQKTKLYQEKFYKAAADRDVANKMGRYEKAERLQKLVSLYYNRWNGAGYFRDSYNDSNLLWRFGLIYWRDFENWLIDRENEDEMTAVSVDGAKWLLSELKSREAAFEQSLASDKFDDWSESREEIVEYFRMKYLKLRVFLKMAIKFNQPINWSV